MRPREAAVDRGPGVGLGQVAVRRQVRQQLGQGRAQPFAGRPIQHRPALPQQLHRFRTVYTWWATHGAGGSGLPRGRSVRAAGIALRAWSRCQLVTAHTWDPRQIHRMTGLPSMSAALRNAVRILLPGLAPLAEGRVPKGRPDADQRSEADHRDLSACPSGCSDGGDGCSVGHPLTPPEVRPAMNHRWKATKMVSTGTKATMMKAENSPQKFPNPVVM
jgi:hypothetical protein